ncbi:unnamed protein product [Rotaria sp. Silwood1]|nr:unnamed protein product [Rotaria sp. Silwood1]
MQYSFSRTYQHVDETNVGQWSLYTKIDTYNLRCYNEKHDGSDKTVVATDDDPELLFTYQVNPSHFSRVTHLSLYFPSNFGNETTRIYYIGLCGEYLGEVQFKVVITTYEATPQLKDHKVDDFQPGTREIQ